MGSILPVNEETQMSSKECAELQDANDSLRHFRKEFIIPTKADLKRKTLAKPATEASPEDQEECIYLCGNSLGLQPRLTQQRIATCLAQWSTKAVLGHFVEHDDSPLAPFVHTDDATARLMAPIVGASESEVAVMGQLTANLLLMLASFYRPTKQRYKIILEDKAFPSDHYAIESQIALQGFDPREAMVLVQPDNKAGTISTKHILQVIDEHASKTALVLLPGVQFYTGQYLNIPEITKHAHSKDIPIGWDCAHAAGNVDLRLHDWDVDFAVWCTYKYLNSGPGATAAIFVHEKHGRVNVKAQPPFRARLCGWWGADKDTRFQMENKFIPRPGAAGYQLSNPSALDHSAIVASLEIFNQTSMREIRNKSFALTNYLAQLLHTAKVDGFDYFTVITPDNAAERGAQLSVKLAPGLLDGVLLDLQANAVIVDERKPDVIRVAPAPLYNSYADVRNFVRIFSAACQRAARHEKWRDRHIELSS